MSISLDALVFITGWAHVLFAPFTKVEESFNLHATHDVLMYGVRPSALHNYDHFKFPSPVPRTFVGPVLLAWAAEPVIRLAAWAGYVHTKFDLQILVRMTLAMLNAISLVLVRRAVSKRFGRPTSLFFVLISCSQFHLPFWMGRTVPNMFALIPVNLANFFLLNHAPAAQRPSSWNLNWALSLLIFTTVVFRAEVVLLLVPLALQALYLRHISFLGLIKVGLISGLFSLALTVGVDTYFHQSPVFIWPEFAGIWFNIVEGKSSEWGTSPIHTYITTYLPKLLLSALPLSIPAIATESRIRRMLFPAGAFVLLISLLGHKEWRFVVYVVPMFNVAAARGAQWMTSRPKSTPTGRIAFFATLFFLFANLAFTVLSMQASMANYPGGQAMMKFQYYYPRLHAAEGIKTRPNIHISNLAAQTGATLFTQLNAPPYYTSTILPPPPPFINAPWGYNKTEHLSAAQLASPSSHFTHVITEFFPPSSEALSGRGWKMLFVEEGFKRWEVDWEVLKSLKGVWEVIGRSGGVWGLAKMERKEMLWVMERVEDN